MSNYLLIQDLKNLPFLEQRLFPSDLLSISTEHQELINCAN